MCCGGLDCTKQVHAELVLSIKLMDKMHRYLLHCFGSIDCVIEIRFVFSPFVIDTLTHTPSNGCKGQVKEFKITLIKAMCVNQISFKHKINTNAGQIWW